MHKYHSIRCPKDYRNLSQGACVIMRKFNKFLQDLHKSLILLKDTFFIRNPHLGFFQFSPPTEPKQNHKMSDGLNLRRISIGQSYIISFNVFRSGIESGPLIQKLLSQVALYQRPHVG